MADIASTSTAQPTAAAVAAAAQHFADEQEPNEFREIVWGSNIRLDVFQRWSQGLFAYSTQNIRMVLRAFGILSNGNRL